MNLKKENPTTFTTGCGGYVGSALVSKLLELGYKVIVYDLFLYGEQSDVREDSPPKPLTDYSKFKLECERILEKADLPKETTWTIIRPATICGYAKRLRLDLVVNILTINALENSKIKVFGGTQLRPNITVNDMARAYIAVLEAPAEKVHIEAFNAGYHNMELGGIANLVKKTLNDKKIEIETVPTNDLRSYHINSEKIKNRIGFEAKDSLDVAVTSLRKAYKDGLIVNGLNNEFYHNIKRMQSVNLK